jgi:hypothetical protein
MSVVIGGTAGSSLTVIRHGLSFERNPYLFRTIALTSGDEAVAKLE